MKRYLFTSALHSLSLVMSAGMMFCIDAGEASANPQGGTISAGETTIQGQGACRPGQPGERPGGDRLEVL